MRALIVAPIVLPALTAALLVLALRHRLDAQRIVSTVSTGLLVVVAALLYVTARSGPPLSYDLGDWPAPFGITLVLDRLSATLVLVTALLGAAVLAYALAGWDRRGRHFHPLFQFQLMGLAGAFLTGDVFNLFVFFEVMLIASYGLLLHGGGARRLNAGLRYVAVNLVGSTLFLFAVGLIYAVTGTLNMADLAAKVATVPAADAALLRTGALLLLVVFALKAALVPLHWWLPGSYGAAPGPVAALFMVMTKVGAYAILRLSTLVFGPQAGALSDLAAPWLMPVALASLALGAVGVLASRSLVALAGFSVVWSMGSLTAAFGMLDAGGIAAGLYYLIHSTLSGAALFLVADLVGRARGSYADQLVPAPALPRLGSLAVLFFVAAIAVTGLPPLSGFLGKLLVLAATGTAPAAPWIWAMLLATSLVVIVGFARAGSTLFWKTVPGPAPQVGPPTPIGVPIAVCAALVAATALLAAFAGPVTDELAATTRQVLDTEAYRSAVRPMRTTLQGGTGAVDPGAQP
ncbi:monovalent cation/H+ antiporter subunit D [Rhodoplanes serenus]|uniref:monovalent cation/H+ antiporter subunit D n=1 Tax=Rhodoplanes serenus TaxID=200615 RepID=UPI000DAC4C80|nr:monovalent cation/H+ antiporter subunit D [Rhodoplanes serenus]RAI34373.1 monovalent cation/H+ antiporter subunit D [Rhodoplanes serenus]